jgi:hypothetical protein
MIQTIPIKPGGESALGTEHWCARAWRRATQGNTARGTIYVHALRPFRYTVKNNATVLYCVRRSSVARYLLAQLAGLSYQVGLIFLKCFYFLFEPIFVFEQSRNALAQYGVDWDASKEVGDTHKRVVMSNDGTERRGRPSAFELATDVARPRSLQ